MRSFRIACKQQQQQPKGIPYSAECCARVNSLTHVLPFYSVAFIVVRHFTQARKPYTQQASEKKRREKKKKEMKIDNESNHIAMDSASIAG